MRAVLDANVLFPTILREILAGAAGEGLYQPLWSARILSEWRHAAARLGSDQEAVAGVEIALLKERFSDAMMPDDGTQAIDFNLPDPADRHVIEAALAGEADQIVTANMRDFPRGIMASLGLRAIHPDAFLLALHDQNAAIISKVIRDIRDKAARIGGEMTVAEMLKRSRLPRLAKAIEA